MRFLKLAVAFGLLFATSAHAEWLMVHIADARGESTGDKGASVSAELPTAGKCKFTIKGNRTSSIKCDYFNLAKGTFKGGRHWNIQMEVGGEVSTVKMSELGRRDGLGFIPFAGFFAVEPTQKIIAAAMNPAAVNDPEDALTLSIPYYKQGVVPLKFPLNGLREALEGSGIAGAEESDDRREGSYCRANDVLDPGDSCGIFGTNIDFWVSSSGAGCMVAPGVTFCHSRRLNDRYNSLIDEQFSLQATGDGDGWTIHDVNPKP